VTHFFDRADRKAGGGNDQALFRNSCDLFEKLSRPTSQKYTTHV